MPRRLRHNLARRKVHALQTRRQILEAAQRLFLEWGYGGTTTEMIATEAGVGTATVFATFSTKRNLLLAVVDSSVMGGGEPLPPLEHLGLQRVQQEQDQRHQIQLFAQGIRAMLERVGPLFEVLRSAAATEPEIASLLEDLLARRLAGMRVFVEALTRNGPLRPGLGVPKAVDVVWALASAEVHRLLTVDRGWSGDQYEAWLGESLVGLLPQGLGGRH